MSDAGTTEPKYFCTSSGCLVIASDMEQKITPTLANSLAKFELKTKDAKIEKLIAFAEDFKKKVVS